MTQLSLIEIQALQFKDIAAANSAMTDWLIANVANGRPVADINIQPSAVSLNSIKGTGKLDGREIFFKTHTENFSRESSNASKDALERKEEDRLYNERVLLDAGYRIVPTLESRTEPGSQIVIYDGQRIGQTMFDLVHAAETSHDSELLQKTSDAIVRATNVEAKERLRIYAQQHKFVDGQSMNSAPVQRLFGDRIKGSRLSSFYEGDASYTFPNGIRVPISRLLDMKWTINGQSYERSLGDCIDIARSALTFDPNKQYLAVPGHGDDHPGNRFLVDDHFEVMAAAFGGWHHPAMDAVKFVYHGVFARWMYFPNMVSSEQSDSRLNVHDDLVEVEFAPVESSYRSALYEELSNSYLRPLFAWIRAVNPEGYDEAQQIFNACLLCCPLLTVNPTATKYSGMAGLLGLAQAVQVSHGDMLPTPTRTHSLASIE